MKPRCFALILVWAVVVAPAVFAGTGPQAADEYEVKAAFLYNFARFVEWPPEAMPDGNAALRLCVLGEHEFGGYLEPLEGRLIRGRPVTVIEATGTSARTKDCHVIFVSRLVDDVGKVLSDHAGLPVLTVTETEEPDSARGIINLAKSWSGPPESSRRSFRIVFEVDPAAAEAARLRVGTRLLELALIRSDRR